MARKTAQQRRIEALIARLEPQVRAAFMDAIRSAGAAIDEKALTAALDARDIQAALALFRLDQGLLYPLEEAVRGAYIAGGTAVLAGLPKTIAGGFGFNGRHIRAEQWTATIGSRLIQGIQSDTLEMAQRVITQGLADNIGTRAVARSLTGTAVGGKRVGGFLGLTTQQADSIISGRAKLASGDPALMREYLDLKLRDKRFDGTIKKAIAEGRAIKGAELDRIIQGHQTKALGYRGKLIARNETFTAQAAGRHEAYRQLAESPKVEKVTKKWVHGHSVKPRPDHVAMDGETIDLDEVFVMDDGARMAHPHDPAGGAEHSLNCRCTLFYRAVPKRD